MTEKKHKNASPLFLNRLISVIDRIRWPLLFFVTLILLRFLLSALYVSFSQDSARDLILIENLIQQGQWVVSYGPKVSMWNFYLPPFYYQLHLLVSLLSASPLAMKLVITAVESFTPILVFLIIQLLLNKRAAYLGAAVYTISRLVIIFSVNAWNPNMIPFFTTLALYAWLQYLKHDKRRYIPIGVLAVALAIQLHYQAFVVVPFIGVLFLYSLVYRPQSWKYWLAGLGLAMLSFSSYFYAEILNNWQNTREIVNYFTLEHTNYYDNVSKPDYLFEFLPGFTERVFSRINHNLWLGKFVLVFGFGVLIYRSLRPNKPERWLLLYFLTILVMLRVYKGIKLDYYMSTLFILPPILMAVIWNQFPRVALVALGVIGFWTGQDYIRGKPYNDFIDFQNTFKVLNTVVGKRHVRILFHNDDNINTYAYGFRHLAGFTIDSNSQDVLEICENQAYCASQRAPQCAFSRGYTFSRLLKEDQQVSEDAPRQIDFPNLRFQPFVLTHFSSLMVIPSYPLYLYNQQYGSDNLIPEAYVWNPKRL